MEDMESYHKRLRAARMRSQGVVMNLIRDGKELLIAFPQHDGLFKLPPGRKDLLARIKESHEKQQHIAFTFDGELTIVSID
jgi:hypothetical protein